ncbi:MAG: hypothetical protein ACRCXT_16110 [Paraclostridium sp.]
MEKLIHKHIYKGQIKKTDKAELHLCYCSADKCEALDSGKCIHLGVFRSCIYGRKVQQDGYTRKSRKFSEWIEKREEEYKDTPSLKNCEARIVECGEHIYFGHAHISWELNENAFSHTRKDTFMPKVEFTVERLKGMIDMKPQALFGGEITDYQKKSVPTLLLDIKDKYPDIFKELIEKYPEVVDRVPKTNVGRKARINTLKIGAEFKDGKNIFRWNGLYIESIKYDIIFTPFKNLKSCEFYASDDDYVIIENDDQVDEDTIYL